MLKHQQISIRRDAAATLVNITGRHPERKDHILLNGDFLDEILFVGTNDMLKVLEKFFGAVKLRLIGERRDDMGY